MPKTNIIIAGGGMAGLSLGLELVERYGDLGQLIIIDREQKSKNDRTWCFWTTEITRYESILHQSWNRLAFRHPDHDVVIPLEPYRYVMLKGEDFYRFARARLESDPRVRMVYADVLAIHDQPFEVGQKKPRSKQALSFVPGANYSAPGSAGPGTPSANPAPVWVDTSAGSFEGDFVFDGLFIAKDFVVDTKRYYYLKQHFGGLVIRTKTREVFDPEVPTLFDLRLDQDGAFRFMYILPSDKRSALVEYTFFSEQLLTKEQYFDGVHSYLKTYLGLEPGEYEIVEEETGIIPMCNQPFPRRTAYRTMTIGSKGGRVKASTGFAFWRTQLDSRRIVDSLLEHGHPFAVAPAPKRYESFDMMLLSILKNKPELGAKIFAILFRKNPITRLFRFLDEDGKLGENIALMLSVPPLPFIGAWIRNRIFGKL